MKAQHLILFDDTCSFCLRSVNRIRGWDKKKRFTYSPLIGDLAKKVLKKKWNTLKNANTLVLVENYSQDEARVWIKGRAVMRILWLIGGWGMFVGWLAYVPLGIDQAYSFIAKRRHRF